MLKLPVTGYQSILFVFAFYTLFTGCTDERTVVTKDAFSSRVDSLLGLMTIEEKIGQMTLFTSHWDVTGPVMRESNLEDIRSGRLGTIFNAHSAAYTRDLQKIAVEESRLGIPLLFGYDVIHGYKTIFPIPLGESSSWDPGLAEKAARIAAVEATAAGLHWTFAPMVDIARDPRWGRISEGAGEDPYLGQVFAKARVRGFQGKDIADPNTILACIKHFAAYGAAQAGRDYHTVDLSERTLREVFLPPYHAGIEAGAWTVMTSFNEINGVPATGDEWLLTDVLRKEWGFDGFIVTDYTSINEMVPHGVVANHYEAAELAVESGVDMDMQGAVYYDHLDSLVKEGRVDEKLIDAAVRRILRAKYALGLFEDPYRYGDEEKERQVILSKEHRDFAREAAARSMVLLKNANETLPISENGISRIALIGPLADNQPDMLGNWHAAGNANDCITLRQGLEERLEGSAVRLNYLKGCEITGDDRSGFVAAISAARSADMIILALGESERMSGEAGSRSKIGLPGVQQDLADAIMAVGKPVIVVLFNGRPLAIPELHRDADAILEAWFPGTEAGRAVADVLFGDVNPSGKLTATFPVNEGQIPIFYAMKNTGRPFLAEQKYTSKYLDVPNEPLYPFGYGLSYTSFAYGPVELDRDTLIAGDSLKASIVLKNTGQRSGAEVVQLYVRDLVGSVTRPLKELKGFQRVELDPGEEQMVRFNLSERDLAFYTKDMTVATEKGDFEVFIVSNSAGTNKAQFYLKKEE